MLRDKHPLAGQTVEIDLKWKGGIRREKYHLEDWWQNVIGGKSWMYCDGNPACIKYGFRSGMEGLPLDNEVVYGKIGSFGELVHISEIVTTVDLEGSKDGTEV